MRSADLHTQAVRLMPGGVSSPVRAFRAVDGIPRYIRQGKGSRLRDVDGKEYVDLCCSFGPLILGHAHPAVVDAVRRAAGNGLSFGTPNEDELTLAKHIIELHPAVEKLRFVNSGTEAVMSALRVARAWSRRDMILKFDGCYHGHSDSLLVKAGSGLATFTISSSGGITEGTVNDTAILPLNNEERLKEFFDEKGDHLAAAVMEAVPANSGLLIQRVRFLRTLERLCRKHGAAFIVDEVITGFRLGFGGATEHYDLKPDLVTLGKIIGGGLPVGAYGGRDELMSLVSPEGPVYQAGTLSGNPITMAAGRATLETLMDTRPHALLERMTTRFADRLKEVAAESGVPAIVPHIASILWILMQESRPPLSIDEIQKGAVDRFATLHKESLERGTYLPPSAFEVEFLSTAHDPSALDAAAEGLSKAFKEVSARHGR